MKPTLSRAASISIHLERHRRCLVRHRQARGSTEADPDDAAEIWNLPPYVGLEALPFARRNDDD